MNRHCKEDAPRWAQRMDTYGREHFMKEKAKTARNGEYIGAIIFNLIFFWVVNKIPDWHLGFIKDNFMVVMWILKVNIVVQIAGNSLLLIGLPSTLKYLTRMITELSGFITTMVMFYIYPFDFSHFHGLFWLDWFLPLAFIIAMVVSAVKVISNLWKMIFWQR